MKQNQPKSEYEEREQEKNETKAMKRTMWVTMIHLRRKNLHKKSVKVTELEAPGDENIDKNEQ